MNRNNSSCKQLVLVSALSALTLTAAAQNDNIVYKDSNVRFTLVTDGTVRMEYAPDGKFRRTRQTLWSAVQMLTQKLCCQTIHDCPKVVPLHYESE